MFEAGMRFFEVQYRRHGKDVGAHSLHAWDEADAIARAGASYRDHSGSGLVSNPYDEEEGLEVRVGLIVEPRDQTQTTFGDWHPV